MHAHYGKFGKYEENPKNEIELSINPSFKCNHRYFFLGCLLSFSMHKLCIYLNKIVCVVLSFVFSPQYYAQLGFLYSLTLILL